MFIDSESIVWIQFEPWFYSVIATHELFKTENILYKYMWMVRIIIVSRNINFRHNKIINYKVDLSPSFIKIESKLTIDWHWRLCIKNRHTHTKKLLLSVVNWRFLWVDIHIRINSVLKIYLFSWKNAVFKLWFCMLFQCKPTKSEPTNPILKS